jgi:hypothetical protein
MIIKSVNEKVEISDNASWLIIKDPIEEVKKAEKDSDYFKIITYSCAVFEYYGKQILVWQSKKAANLISTNQVRKLRLEQVIDELSSRSITNANVKTKMHSIRNLRNSFIHNEYSVRISPQIYKQVITSVQDAIDCLKFLD